MGRLSDKKVFMMEVFCDELSGEAIINPSFEDTNKLIALTPEVVHELDCLGVKNELPERYFIWYPQPNYLSAINRWLRKATDVIYQAYPGLLPKENGWMEEFPFAFYFYGMWRNVFDAYFRTITTLERIVDVEFEGGKGNMFLVSRYRGRDKWNEELHFVGCSTWRVAFDHMKKQLPKVQLSPYFVFGAPYFYSARRTWKDNQAIRRVRDFFRCLEFVPPVKRRPLLFFAEPMPKEERQARLRGYRVKRAKNVAVRRLPEMSKGCYKAAYQGAFEEFEEWGFKESTLAPLRWRFLYFLDELIPRVLVYREGYKKILEEMKPACVFFNRRNRLYQHGVLLAAKELGIPTAYVRHGWDAYDVDYRKWTRFAPFDYYVSVVREDKEFYENKCKQWGVRTKVL